MLDYVRKEILERLKPGTPNHDVVRHVLTESFGLADQAVAHRREIRLDTTISEKERRERLKAIPSGPFANRLDKLLEPLAPIRQRLDAARQGLPGTANLTRGEAAAVENLALVDSALYFVRRDLEGR